MKTMKKLCALVVAVVMVLAMGVTAFADEATHTITINDRIKDSDTFEAYQIFAGREENGVLSDITWGSGINNAEDAFLNALKAANSNLYPTSVTSAADVAAILGADGNNAADSIAAQEFAAVASKHLASASGTYADGKITGLADGYYLVKSNDTGTESAETRFILAVVKDETVSVKAKAPESEKKVKDINDSESNSETNWQDSADYDIGDEIPYQLKAKLTDKVSENKVYKISFVDTISKGLTYVANSAKVYVNGTYVKDMEPTPADYSGDNEIYSGGKVLTWDLDDVKVDPYNAGNNAVITIEYKATLNADAKIGEAGNPNEMHITYSRNPNDEQGGTPGKTPDDKVIVFTYKTVVNKFDQDGNSLAGAMFTLQKYNPTTVKYEDYKQNGTVVTATVNTDGSITASNQNSESKTMKAGSQFSFTGLDDGKYQLTESVVPAGYNSINPIQFEITATHDTDSEDPKLVSFEVPSFATNNAAGTATKAVENNSGSVLPSTGGMGTTIFYIVGAVLVLGAGVLLVTRRRVAK